MIIKQLRIVHCFLSVNRSVIRPPDVSQEGLKFLPMNFLFYQSTALSSHAVDGHQMYFRGSVIGKASTIGIEISPTPPLIFTGGRKCEIWRRFQHHSTFSRLHLKMQQDILTPKQISCDVGMIVLCPHQVWWNWVHAPLRTVCQSCPTPKIAQRKRAKS